MIDEDKIEECCDCGTACLRSSMKRCYNGKYVCHDCDFDEPDSDSDDWEDDSDDDWIVEPGDE